MTDVNETDLEAQARALQVQMQTPRRRAQPRSAPILNRAEHALVETPAGPVAAWRVGEGPALLLAHGWEDDHSLFTPLMDALADLALPFVALDLPGHGFSPAPGARLTLCVGAVRAVAEAMGPVWAYVGHSFGATAGVFAVEEGLMGVERMVLIAPPIDQAERWGAFGERFGASPALMARVRALQEEAEGRQLDWFDMRRAAAGMQARCLVVHAEDDEVCPVDGSRELAAAWPGAELLLAEDLGHRRVAQDRDVIVRIVDFLLAP